MLCSGLVCNNAVVIQISDYGKITVTIFSLSASLEGYVFTFADAINGMFMPRISRIHANEGNPSERISELMVNVGRYHIYSIGFIYIGFIVAGRRFVELWMGNGYEDIYLCALLLIFPSLIDVPQQIGRSSLLVKDKVKGQGIAYIAMVALNILLSFILIPPLGVIGASVSICVAYLVRTLILNVMYRKYLELSLGYYYRNAYLRWLVTAVIAILIGLIANHFIPLRGWAGLLVVAAMITAVYIVLLLAVTLDKSQRSFVMRFLRTLKRKNIKL